jgi:hypothetical protein
MALVPQFLHLAHASIQRAALLEHVMKILKLAERWEPVPAERVVANLRRILTHVYDIREAARSLPRAGNLCTGHGFQ